MPDWMKKKDCCYEKKSKVRRNSLEETILTSLSVAACMWGAHPTSAVVRRAQSRQPATSASLPTNRHARLRLCAVLSVSAAEAGRRGTATAAPSIFPGMRLSAATPFFVFAMLWHLAACWFPHSADTGLFLGRGCCCVFFFLSVSFFLCGSRSLNGSAGERVLVNTHSQRRRIRKTSSVTARQLAHTSKCSPFDRSAPSRRHRRCCWRGGDVRSLAALRAFSWAKFATRLWFGQAAFVKNMTADYIFNLQCVQVEVFLFFFFCLW